MLFLLRNLSMRGKLMLLILPALLGTLYFSLSTISERYSNLDHTRELRALFNLALVADPLVENLQKERGLTDLFFATGGSDGRVVERLDAQRELTQASLVQFRTFVGDMDGEVRGLLDSNLTGVTSELAELDQVRGNLRDRDAAQVHVQYTEAVSLLIGLIPEILHRSNEPQLTRLMGAFLALSRASEWGGRELAAGAQVLSNAGTTLALASTVSEATGRRHMLLATAADLVGEPLGTTIADAQETTEIQSFKAMRDKLTGSEYGFLGMANMEWFDTASAAIDVVYRLKKDVTASMKARMDTVVSEARWELQQAAVIGVVVIVAVALLAMLIIRGVSDQVNRLLKDFGQIMEDKNLTVRTEIRSKDEMGRIGHALNSLMETFAGALNQIDKTSVQLAAASEQTRATASSNADQVSGQQQLVEQVATAAEEMSSTSADISQNTHQVADAAGNASSKSAEGRQVVEHTVTRIRGLSQSIERVSDHMDSLRQSSENITRVIDVIKSVADQTNLLALNAAIEAARAGQHGRGFAVVAEEVRALAQQTHQSTLEIEGIVSGFRDTADEVHGAVSETHDLANTTADEAARLEDTLVDILHDVDRISDMATQIAAAAEQQVTVTRDISKSMVSVRDTSLQTLNGSREISQVTVDQAALANELQSLAQGFRV